MHIRHIKRFLSLVPAVVSLLLFSLLLALTYHSDNKYTAGGPYGQNGVYTFTQSDLDRPLFLVDGWMLDGNETFIGQYSNFSYVPGHDSPFGAASYTLTLRYDGEPQTLLMEIPVIFTDYTLSINGVPAASASGKETQILVPVGGGDTLLTLETFNEDHYYSGLTYPPAIGTPGVISRMFFVRTLIYGAVCISGLTLALFSMALWLSRYKDRMFFHFGLLCLAFCLHCAHPLIWQAGLSNRIWYTIEDTSWLFVLAQTLHLTVLAVGLDRIKWYKNLLRPALLLICLLSAAAALFILPANGSFIGLYGAFVDGYKIILWAVLAFLTGMGIRRRVDFRPQDMVINTAVLGATCILGVSLLADVLDSNLFEPIYGLWQNEYAGVLLILLFGGMMVQRIMVLLKESRELSLLSVQYRFAEERAVQIQESAKQVRFMKHELAHHIEALAALCNDGDLKRLERYLQKLRDEKNALPVLAYSNHFLVNAILSSYLEPARQKGIRVDCRILIPDELPLPDDKLCTLLSNLLQNAVEACTELLREKQPWIYFEMDYQDGLLSFLCRNQARPGSSTGPFPTTKADKVNHGLGLTAITHIVEKYHGAVGAVLENETFTVRGALSLKNEKTQ
ncbi:GHKL domain-containing protein [Blautia schinkii]|nr:GHKL domain-containing protein [Blautia schinkii]